MKKPGTLKKWWKREKTEVRQFIFCLLGVLMYKGLDIAGERLDLSGLSFAFLGFAIAIALFFTWVTDNDPLPAKLPDEKPEDYAAKIQSILRRVSKNAVLMGFFWQTVLSKLQDAIQI